MISKILLSETYQPKLTITIWLEVFLILTTACSPEQTISPEATTATPSTMITVTVQCEQTLVPPDILEIQPAEPIPGSEINVIGSGGYIQDTCGGYIEGSKIFKLYLDNEPIGDLSCYVNRCEGKLTLPGTLSTGTHCLSVQPDECQFEFQITAG
jgi:hypothetical protein